MKYQNDLGAWHDNLDFSQYMFKREPLFRALSGKVLNIKFMIVWETC